MKKDVLVSVLVPLYNVERYVGRCLESIISQTYSNLEIIIVDDKSPDHSYDIAKKYADKDERIKIFRHDRNKLFGGGRNTGLENAHGEYVVFVDSDDWLAPDFIEYMLKNIVGNRADVALSENNFTSRDTEQISEEDFVSVMSPEDFVAELFYPRITLGVWNKIYKRSFIEKHKLRFNETLRMGEGFEFMVRLAQENPAIVCGRKKAYYYRLNNAMSACTVPSVEKATAALEALRVIEKELVFGPRKIVAAVNWHNWAVNFYILKMILLNGSQKLQSELYRDTLRNMRKYALAVILHSRIKAKTKAKVFLSIVAPVTIAKIVNRGERRLIENDRTE